MMATTNDYLRDAGRNTIAGMQTAYRRKVALELINWLEIDASNNLDANATDLAEQLEEDYPTAYFFWGSFDAAVNPDETLADLIA
jgi:hypothetical protein